MGERIHEFSSSSYRKTEDVRSNFITYPLFSPRVERFGLEYTLLGLCWVCSETLVLRDYYLGRFEKCCGILVKGILLPRVQGGWLM